jgi:hypothetical protein
MAFIGYRNQVVLCCSALEWTMSGVTMLNSAQRNRQFVCTVVAMAQVGVYYRNVRPSRVRTRFGLDSCKTDSLFRYLRRSAHPNPVIKFFDIERLLRPIENRNATTKLDHNYDESDDEEEVDLRNIGDDGAPSE